MVSFTVEKWAMLTRRLMGSNAAVINEVLSAKEIVDEMISTAKRCIERGEAALNGGRL